MFGTFFSRFFWVVWHCWFTLLLFESITKFSSRYLNACSKLVLVSQIDWEWVVFGGAFPGLSSIDSSESYTLPFGELSVKPSISNSLPYYIEAIALLATKLFRTLNFPLKPAYLRFYFKSFCLWSNSSNFLTVDKFVSDTVDALLTNFSFIFIRATLFT